MKLFDCIKDAYKNYLNKLQKANKDAFGNTAPSCCSLNSQKLKTHKQG